MFVGAGKSKFCRAGQQLETQGKIKVGPQAHRQPGSEFLLPWGTSDFFSLRSSTDWMRPIIVGGQSAFSMSTDLDVNCILKKHFHSNT